MLSLGMLSWRAHDTLRKTLSSYTHLLPLVDEAVIYFNALTPEDKAIAEEFGFRAEGGPENLGILGGTLELVKCLKGDTVILVQNDNPVNVPPDVLAARIADAKRLLSSGSASMVRLRDRFDPTFSDRLKYLEYWPADGEPDTFSLKLRRLLRPFKAHRMIGRAPAELKDPAKAYPDIFKRDGFTFITDSRYTNYSDQPFMASHKLTLELLEWADAHKEHSRTLNGHPVAEVIINGKYWRNRKVRVAISEGVFAHARYDDSFRPTHEAYNEALSAESSSSVGPSLK